MDEREPPEPAPARHTGDRTSADERHHATLALFGLLVAFVSISVAYVILAAGEILG
jgi:hypothetical protein